MNVKWFRQCRFVLLALIVAVRVSMLPMYADDVPPPALLSWPSVFVIGDSVSIQYGTHLEPMLADRFEYDRKGGSINLGPVDGTDGSNGGDSSMVLTYLGLIAEAWGENTPDYVMLNCGLHDVKRTMPEDTYQVPIDEYENNLRTICGTLRDMGIGVVWARTTPVVDRPDGTEGTIRFNSDVMAYNAVADAVMADYDISVIDLYTFTRNLGTDIYSDGYVHFNEDTQAKQAAFIAGALFAWPPQVIMVQVDSFDIRGVVDASADKVDNSADVGFHEATYSNLNNDGVFYSTTALTNGTLDRSENDGNKAFGAVGVAVDANYGPATWKMSTGGHAAGTYRIEFDAYTATDRSLALYLVGGSGDVLIIADDGTEGIESYDVSFLVGANDIADGHITLRAEGGGSQGFIETKSCYLGHSTGNDEVVLHHLYHVSNQPQGMVIFLQ